MLRRATTSFSHAWEGLIHAVRRERNVRLFLVCYTAFLIVLAALFRLRAWEWVALFLAGGTFLAVELLNTAIERLTDAVDELRGPSNGYHAMLRAAKDVAAAASLVSLVTVGAACAAILVPRIVA